MSNSLWPYGLQHARPPCPSPTWGVYSNSCPLNQWCHPTISSSVVLFSSCPQFSHHHGLLQWVSSSHQVAKVLEFQLQHQSFQWTPRTDLFRMDWLDLLAVQGTPKSLLQHHSSKASILLHSAFFLVQLSHPYMTTGKTIALTRRTFVDKVMSLLFNMLSSTLAWKIPWMEEPGWLQSMGSLESDTTEWLHSHFSLSCIGEGNGQPTPVFLPGESQGWGSLLGCHLWGCTESDMTKAMQQQQKVLESGGGNCLRPW